MEWKEIGELEAEARQGGRRIVRGYMLYGCESVEWGGFKRDVEGVDIGEVSAV